MHLHDKRIHILIIHNKGTLIIIYPFASTEAASTGKYYSGIVITFYPNVIEITVPKYHIQ